MKKYTIWKYRNWRNIPCGSTGMEEIYHMEVPYRNGRNIQYGSTGISWMAFQEFTEVNFSWERLFIRVVGEYRYPFSPFILWDSVTRFYTSGLFWRKKTLPCFVRGTLDPFLFLFNRKSGYLQHQKVYDQKILKGQWHEIFYVGFFHSSFWSY